MLNRLRYLLVLVAGATLILNSGCLPGSSGSPRMSPTDQRTEGATADHPKPTPAATPAPIPRRPTPASLAVGATIWTGPELGATKLGDRNAGTAIHVTHQLAGDRLEAYDQNSIHNKFWVDVAAVALSQDAWEIMRPPRTTTATAVCPVATDGMTPSVPQGLLDAAVTHAESYVPQGAAVRSEEEAPGLTLLVRFGNGTGGFAMEIPRLSKPQLVEAGPEPSKWDRKRHEEWKARVEENRRRLQAHEQQVASVRAAVDRATTALQGLALPTRGSLEECAVQSARELDALNAPSKALVLLTDASKPPVIPGSLPSLRGVRATLALFCLGSSVTCQANEAAWLRALADAGALSRRSVQATGPTLALAFQPPAPVIRQ